MEMMEAINYLRLLLSRYQTDEKGVTTVEYAIMLVLVALAVAAFGLGLSGAVTGVFSRMISALNAAS
jgi:Flp pilus assembly pilin Flp